MLNRKPLAAALAALSLACTGALAQGGHRDEIHIESFSWGATSAGKGRDNWIEVQSFAVPNFAPQLDQSGPVKATTPLDDARLKGQKILQNASGARPEKYLEIKMEKVIVSPVLPSSTPAPRDLSAPKPPPSAAWYAKFDGVDGSSKQSVPGARPLAPVPQLVAPQRSPLADGTSNTLMIGEKVLRPASTPTAPAVRR
jgi:Type VI secretion system effector, Hcp